jgi:hypothetical protein
MLLFFFLGQSVAAKQLYCIDGRFGLVAYEAQLQVAHSFRSDAFLQIIVGLTLISQLHF